MSSAESAPKKRRTRSELRELMIDAGVEVMLELLPLIGSEQLSYSAVFQHLQETKGIRVTTGSVHERLWQSQREYQLDVLREILQRAPLNPFEVSQGAIAEALGMADLSSFETRRYALQNATRLLQNRSFAVEGFRDSSETIAYAVRFHLMTNREITDEFHELATLSISNRDVTMTLYVQMIKDVCDHLGLRPRPMYGDTALETLTVIGNAVTAGALLDPAPRARALQQLPTGRNGEMEEWHPSAIAAWSAVQEILEFDDDSVTAEERRL